ncbi:MAG: DUF4339 domain-containing protein [Bdellovibrionales bacterium]|nr:DUF4339 domain-containing protein [Bdellovibrionales bacterium]
MQTLFYVSMNGQEFGPWAIGEIKDRMAKGEIQLTDYVYDEAKQDWVLILECSAIADSMKAHKPKAPPTKRRGLAEDEGDDTAAFNERTVVAQAKETPHGDAVEEWFVLKWDNRYGPFTYSDLIRMLQEKTVFEFDYVWKTGMETWHRIAERPEFKPDKVRELAKGESKSVSDLFFRRRHLRTKYNGSIIIHDNSKVWKGESFEMSEGGAGIVMHNAMLLPGQTVYVHFKPGDNVPPFNAVCEIVNKKYVKGVKDRSAPLSYGIKFININQEAKSAIKKFAHKAAA